MKVAIAGANSHNGKAELLSALNRALSVRYRIGHVDLDLAQTLLEDLELNDDYQLHKINKAIPEWKIDHCTQCGICEKICHFEVIEIKNEKVHIRKDLCTSCNLCVDYCPELALKMVYEQNGTLVQFKKENSKYLLARLNPEESYSSSLFNLIGERSMRYFSEEDIFLIATPSSLSYSFIQAISGSDVVILVIDTNYWSAENLQKTLNLIREEDLYVVAAIIKEDKSGEQVELFCEKEYLEVVSTLKPIPGKPENGDFDSYKRWDAAIGDIVDFLDELYLDLNA